MTGGWPIRVCFAAGLLALALGGGWGLGLGIVATIGIALPAPPLPPRAWPWVHGAVLAATGALAGLGPPTTAFALLVSWLLVHRAWTGRTGDDARVALLLATLLLLLGAVTTTSIVMAPLFIAYAAALPVALLRAEAQDAVPRGIEVTVGVGAAVLAGVLFVALPRLDGGYLSGRGANVRFPSDVTLGGEGLVNDDRAEVMRVRVTDPDGRGVGGPFHLRGRTFDSFDGTRWTERAPVSRPPLDDTWDQRAEVWLEPIGGEVLFGLPDIVRVDGVAVRREAGSTLFSRGGARALHYRAFARTVPLGRIATEGVEPWLQLPELDPRVFALAWTVASEEPDPTKVARALSDWLSNEYSYLETPPAPEGDPLAWFLFDAREGHCEYFASALAVLLRVRGIPARLATGFHSGELDDDGAIVVRRGNAHAWVEVRTTDGWATLDPTPLSGMPVPMDDGLVARIDALLAGWQRQVIDYDMDAQFAAYGVIGKRVLFSGEAGQSPIRAGVVGMIVVVLGMFSGLAVLRVGLARLGAPGRRSPPDEVGRLVTRARRVAYVRGWRIPTELPALAAAEWLVARAGPSAEPMRRLAEITYASRYGGEVVDLGEARRCVRALWGLPRAK